jgi:SAM-dependent methyltransferase
MINQTHYQSLEYERVRRLLRCWIEQKAVPLRVLDYGCGRGKYLRLFRSLGCTVVGVDGNPDYVREGIAADFTVYHVDDFKAEKPEFDVVFLSHIIEHVSPSSLVDLIPTLCGCLHAAGKLVIISPVLGERFYYDFSHIRPFYPQSIRHAFGQNKEPISFGGLQLINLTDIYFFKDPYRPRTWRSYYVATGVKKWMVWGITTGSDLLWRISGGQVGALASWLGVYEKISE